MVKYKNKSKKEEYKLAFNQINLGVIYESAKARMKAHHEYADEQKKIIQNASAYENEDEAVEDALKLPDDKLRRCKIWAEIEKDEEYYRIKPNRWLLTYESHELKAAEYIGMVVMYDDLDLEQYLK